MGKDLIKERRNDFEIEKLILSSFLEII